MFSPEVSHNATLPSRYWPWVEVKSPLGAWPGFAQWKSVQMLGWEKTFHSFHPLCATGSFYFTAPQHRHLSQESITPAGRSWARCLYCSGSRAVRCRPDPLSLRFMEGLTSLTEPKPWSPKTELRFTVQPVKWICQTLCFNSTSADEQCFCRHATFFLLAVSLVQFDSI